MRHALFLLSTIVAACAEADSDVIRFFDPSKPTYQQVERLIATAQEANGETVDWPYIWTNRTAYATPTYGQVERLIAEVQKGTNATPVDLSSRTTFEQATNISEYVVSDSLRKIKINGQSLSPNVTITTYAPFKDAWVTSSTGGIDAFFSKVAADADVKKGTAFLGALKGASTPWGSGNAEAELKVMANVHGTLIYVVTVYSTDISPYFWFNMSVAGGHNNGWRKYALDGSGGGGITHEDATNAAVQVVKDDVADWALAGNMAPITNVTINTTTLSVDPETRIASGTIATCGPFPTGWQNNTTTILFCESIALNIGSGNKSGVMYMGTVNLTDSGSESPKLCEVIVTVVADNRTQLSPTDPEDFQGAVILKLETTSTNNRMRHWMTMYEKFGTKSTYEHGRWPHGKISYGGSRSPWLGMLFKPLDDQAGAEEKLTDPKYIAASMEDLKKIMAGSDFDFRGGSEVTKTLYEVLTNVIIRLGGTVSNPISL